MNKPSKIQNSINADYIFYYGQECPHCHNVLKYVADNKIDQKLKIENKEVYHNEENKTDLGKLVATCPEIQNPEGGIGVPILFIVKDKKCLLGDQPIIDKYKELSTAM